MFISVLAATVAMAIIAWVGIDAARRRRNWIGWSGAASFLGVLGLLAWLLRRRRIHAQPEPIGFWRGLGIVLTAPALFALSTAAVVSLTTFVVQAARVEGRSMAPTLEDQDRLVVDKMVYQRRDPRAGEIVMLHYPLRPDRLFVMRVIGEEGDMIRIVDGRLFRNDVQLEEPYLQPELRSHERWGPEVVPEGYYFVMGDNRINSSDSRHWKYVPRRYIVGRIALRWWPLSRAGAI